MANIADSAVSRVLAEILKDIDGFPGLDPGFDHGIDTGICRAIRRDGSRCRNRTRASLQGSQIDDLLSKFQSMTECPNTDVFYDDIKTFITLTHCNRHHLGIAIDDFYLWKARRQAVSNSPPNISSTIEISNDKHHDSFPEIIDESTRVESLDSISVEEHVRGLQDIPSDVVELILDRDSDEFVKGAATDSEPVSHSSYIGIEEEVTVSSDLKEQRSLPLSRSVGEIKVSAASSEAATTSSEEAAAPIVDPNENFTDLESETSNGLTRKSSGLSNDPVKGNERKELHVDKTKRMVPITIVWNGGGEKVYVTGTIFQWNKKCRLHAIEGRPGAFAATINVLPGTHHIRFLVDGIMQTTPDLPTTVDFGNNLINYIEVRSESSWPRDEWEPADETNGFLSEPDPHLDTTAKIGDSLTDKAPERLVNITQETEKNIIAPPPTDSGYGSTSVTESKHGMSMRHTDIEQPAHGIPDQDISDTATEYSDESRSTFSKKKGFVSELANELFQNISSLNADEITQTRVSDILPELLQGFALKVGYGGKTQIHRDVMAFVHRYRREIAAEFTDISFNKDSEDSNQKNRGAEDMSWPDRISLWIKKTSFEDPPEESEHSAAEDGEALEENSPDKDDEIRERYRKFLTSSSAYEELLARLQREFYLVPAKFDIMGDIREKIMSSLPSPRKISKKISPRSCHAIFQLDWDIINFFNAQGYLKEPYEVFERVITITGSRQDAQAATCAQYIKQTWPFIGEIVIRLVKDVLKGAARVYQLPNETKITAWVSTPKFMLEVYGVSVSIAEIGELFSWLGAALRTSPRHRGLVYSVPSIRNIVSNITPSTRLDLSPSSTHAIYEIEFAMELVSQSLPAANGQCWHNIFKNPVVVRGYPIPQRLERNTGLEISLNIMAGLARTRRVNRFKEKVYIKGFSTMLVPTKKNTDIICWHLIYNKDGDHISYLDDDQDQEQYIGQLDLKNYRHVLGWCSEAKLYAGSAGSHHPVMHSRLPKPHTDCAFYGMRVLEGKLILDGPAFIIGARDTPEYIARRGNIRRLKWISTKFILLWDERDKRGWLINGTTALLHIVRAFLSHAKEDNFKSAFHFKDEDLQEAEIPFTADSAIAVLLNPRNRNLKLYEEEDGDDDEYLFKTQIDHYYNILEQLIVHQADIAGYNGLKLSNNPRKYLEGWDFEDMAKECPTIYPRVATIADAGKGWVDFIRAINAVTLVGRGFGDIIKPTGRDQCDSWATLPTKRYYIASCVSDLERLSKEAGSHQDSHALLCDNLIYHSPASVYMSCQCRVTSGQRSCEPVRTLIPSAMSKDIPFIKHSSRPRDLGAVILGYNSHFPLVWRDTGPPQLGQLMETEPLSKVSEEDVDSGFGSNSTVSKIESRSFFQPKSETEYSARPEEFQPQTMKKAMPNITIPIDRKMYTWSQYTVGIICPLSKEFKAVRALFDNRHCDLSAIPGDKNQYVLGDMEGHWIVAACLPSGEYGTNAAARLASNMTRSFPSIRFCLLVGVGGGVPSEKRDIRLGDVVVSQPTGTSPGVLQYDLGKEENGGNFQLTGSLQRPPQVLTTAIGTLEADPEPLAGRLRESICKIIDYLPEYRHPGQELDTPSQVTCASCASWQWLLGSCSHIRRRVPRTTTLPTIHYGIIASGNRVVKDVKFRNRLARDHDILCFEMEAAGVMNTVDCLVIRGICDYSDAQKNKIWQEYAAATAAAYAKLLLGVVAKVELHGNMN